MTFSWGPKSPGRFPALICGHCISLFPGGWVQCWSGWPHPSSCPAGSWCPKPGRWPGRSLQSVTQTSQQHLALPAPTLTLPTPTDMIWKPFVGLAGSLMQFCAVFLSAAHKISPLWTVKLSSLLLFFLWKERKGIRSRAFLTRSIAYLLCVTDHWILDQLLIIHE